MIFQKVPSEISGSALNTPLLWRPERFPRNIFEPLPWGVKKNLKTKVKMQHFVKKISLSTTFTSLFTLVFSSLLVQSTKFSYEFSYNKVLIEAWYRIFSFTWQDSKSTNNNELEQLIIPTESLGSFQVSTTSGGNIIANFTHLMLWAIWYHLYNLNVINTYGGVLLLVNLQTPLRLFFTFFKLYK